jgi:hypothetical protein
MEDKPRKDRSSPWSPLPIKKTAPEDRLPSHRTDHRALSWKTFTLISVPSIEIPSSPSTRP